MRSIGGVGNKMRSRLRWVALAILTAMSATFLGSLGLAQQNQLTLTKTVSPTAISCGGQVQVTLSVEGYPAPVAVPVDVVLVIDRSGSMGAPIQKLDDAKTAAKTFVDLMFPPNAPNIHQIGIVSFSSGPDPSQPWVNAARVEAPLLGSAFQSFLKLKIDSLTAIGDTAMGEGLRVGGDVLASHRPGARQVMVFFSDGLANVAPPGNDPIAYAIAQANQVKSAGAEMFTIGLGADADQVTLQKFASQPTATHFFFAPDSSQLRAIYSSIAQWITVPALTVWDQIASPFQVVNGSISPAPVSFDGTTIVWRFSDTGQAKTFTYRLTYPTGGPGGNLSPNAAARLEYADVNGFHALDFPKPTVTVTCGGDTTPPATVASVSPAPNTSGWNNTPVSVTLVASDSGPQASGIKQINYVPPGGPPAVATPPTVTLVFTTTFSVATEGTSLVSYSSVDNAGNQEATKTLTLQIDRTSPSVQASGSPAANPKGWNNTDVVVSFTAQDGLSGIASVDGPVTVSGETAGRVVTGTATDKAGNIGSASYTARIDRTVPQTQVVLDPATPNGLNGWYVGGVGVTLQASDNLSGVAATEYQINGGPWTPYSGRFVVAQDGSWAITVHSRDNAGNQEADHSVTFRIDKTPPTVQAIGSPAPNLAGWNNTNVTVSFTAQDNLSGVASVDAPVVVQTEGQGQVVTGSATDVAGNVGKASYTVNLDKTFPVTVVATNPAQPNGQNGWYVSDVTVTLQGSDNLSGVAGTQYQVNNGGWQGYGGPFTISQEGANGLQYASSDVAGNQEAARLLSIPLDKTPPSITVTSPEPRPYSVGRTLTVQYSAADAVSGVASVVATLDSMPVADAQSVELWQFGVGQHTLAVVARDRAGNLATKLVTFTVIADIPGIIDLKHHLFDLGLIDNAGIVNSLDAKLDAAQRARDRGQVRTARNILYAFINEVEAQDGKHIAHEAAVALIAAAQDVIQTL